MQKKIKKLMIIISIVFLVVSCTENKRSDSAFTVVAIDFPSYDAARFLIGDEAELKLLLHPGVEMHSYEPTPKDMIEIANADLVIFAGGPSDEWVYRILESADNSSYFTLISAVDTLSEEVVEGMESDEDGDEIDEHVWTSPLNEIAILKALSDTLGELSGNANLYHDRFQRTAGDLMVIDDEIREIVSSSANRTLIFASRFPLRYFTEEYGLDYYAAFPGCAEESEPSAKTVAFLIDKAKELRVPCILNIELSSTLIARTIAEEAGCRIETFQSIHNVTMEDFRNGENYITLMKRNIDVLKEALGAY